MKSNERKHGRGLPLSPSKEDTMKKCVRRKPKFRSPLLNIVVALTVMIAFGAMFSTGCKDAADTSEISFEMVFEFSDALDEQTDYSECELSLDYSNTGSEKESNSKEIKFNKLERNVRNCPDKVDTDIFASARGWPDKVGNNFEPKADKVICHEVEDSEGSTIAGINFGNTPGNFGDVPFALFGGLTSAVAITRRQDTVLFSRFKLKDLQFRGPILIAAMFGVIMLASGFAIAVSLTPLVVVGVTAILLMSTKKSVACADGDDASEGCKGISDIDPDMVILSEGNYKCCVKAFRIVVNSGQERIDEVRARMNSLCFLTPEAVKKAYAEVFE